MAEALCCHNNGRAPLRTHPPSRPIAAFNLAPPFDTGAKSACFLRYETKWPPGPDQRLQITLAICMSSYGYVCTLIGSRGRSRIQDRHQPRVQAAGDSHSVCEEWHAGKNECSLISTPWAPQDLDIMSSGWWEHWEEELLVSWRPCAMHPALFPRFPLPHGCMGETGHGCHRVARLCRPGSKALRLRGRPLRHNTSNSG